jgi:hypothetical protein
MQRKINLIEILQNLDPLAQKMLFSLVLVLLVFTFLPVYLISYNGKPLTYKENDIKRISYAFREKYKSKKSCVSMETSAVRLFLSFTNFLGFFFGCILVFFGYITIESDRSAINQVFLVFLLLFISTIILIKFTTDEIRKNSYIKINKEDLEIYDLKKIVLKMDFVNLLTIEVCFVKTVGRYERTTISKITLFDNEMKSHGFRFVTQEITAFLMILAETAKKQNPEIQLSFKGFDTIFGPEAYIPPNYNYGITQD